MWCVDLSDVTIPLPPVVSQLHGALAETIPTKPDGACSIISVWGVCWCSSSRVVKRCQLVPDASDMAKHPYAFVTCLGTGAPWCEQTEDTTFDDFMVTTFGSAVAGGVPSQHQDMEFSCAHPTRNGSNSLLKGASACYVPEARETPRVVFSLRGLCLPKGEARIIRSSPEPGKSATKFWLAIRASEEVKIPCRFANDRYSQYRRRPADICDCLQASLLEEIRKAVLESVASAHKYIAYSRGQGHKRRKRDCTLDFNCLRG